MTQEELADRLGMGYRTLTASEAETRALTAGEIAGLCELGIDANWLVTGEGAMRRGPAPAADVEPPPLGPVVLTADAKEWRAMLVTVLRICQEEGLDMRDAVPDKFADVVDVMIEISKTVPDTAAPDVSVAKRPGILKRIASLLLP